MNAAMNAIINLVLIANLVVVAVIVIWLAYSQSKWVGQ